MATGINIEPYYGLNSVMENTLAGPFGLYSGPDCVKITCENWEAHVKSSDASSIVVDYKLLETFTIQNWVML